LKRDAHYYAILAFCRACGFKKESAHLIAYASQYVDDAKINLMYITNPNDNIKHDLVNNQPALFNMATCHSYFKINTFNYESMVNNISAFHFVPGCKGESFTKKLRCKEESPVILDILNDIFNEDDLIKLGIVLHTYADTFAHQGFSGMLSKVNDIKNCETTGELYLGLIDKMLHVIKRYSREKYEALFDSVIPAYGHGLALDFPDIPYLVWSYEYDCSDEFSCAFTKVEIDNKERYKSAFNMIKIHLENYLKKHRQYVDHNMKFTNFDLLIDALLLQNTDRLREMNWISILIEQGLFDKNDIELIIYEDNEWLKDAFVNYDPHYFNNREVEGVQLADDFSGSHWYHFYLAVKWYKERFFEYCNKYGLSIPN
jgi:hypothetical protein